jgi:hypothetical protein
LVQRRPRLPRSARVGRKGSFVGQIISIFDGEYVVRDAANKKWLRKEDELEPATFEVK